MTHTHTSCMSPAHTWTCAYIHLNIFLLLAYSSRQKEGKEKSQFGTRQKHCTISHDCLTTAMFSSARTCYVLPRICMQNINGAQWRTFYPFASYKGAHTTALQDIKRGNSLRTVDSDATHGFLLPPAPQPAMQGWRQKCSFICKPKPHLFDVQYFKHRRTLRPPLPAHFKK